MGDSHSLSQRIARGLAWSTVGVLVMRMGNLLIGILVARLVAPEQFGVFAVALTVWNVLGTLAEFGLGSDLVRARDPHRRAPTIASLGVLISGALAVTMAFAAGPIAEAFRSPESAGVIRLMAFALLLFGFSIVPAAMLQREYRQGAVVTVNASALVVSASVVTFLAMNGHGPWALAWAQVAQQLALVVGLHLANRSLPRFGFRGDVARESLAFCLPLAAANLVSWLLITFDNLIVARELSAAQLGLYVLAFNVSSWPMNAVGQAIRVVALPAFSGVEDVRARNSGFERSAGPMVAVAVFMGLGLATLSEPVVRVLYGDTWRAAAAALTGLAVFGAIRVVLDLMTTFLIACGATRAVLVVQLVWLVAMVPAMLVGVSWFGLAGAGWAHVVVALVVALPAYAFYLHRLGVDLGRFVQGWVRPLVACVPAALVCGWLGSREVQPLLLLAGGGLAAVTLYAIPLLPWWRRQLRLLRGEPEHLVSTTEGEPQDVLH